MVKLFTFNPDYEELQDMFKYCGYGTRLMIEKKIGDKTRIFCTSCGTFHDLDKKTASQMKKARICPACLEEVKRFTKDNGYSRPHFHNWISIGANGWFVWADVDMDRQEVTGGCDHVYQEVKGLPYKRHCSVTMSGVPFYYPEFKEWRRYKNYWLQGSFYDLHSLREKKGMSKKELIQLKFMEEWKEISFKSNQMQVIKENLLSYEQMLALKAFNLKSADEVYKYRIWIRDQKHSLERLIGHDEELNIHYLKYLTEEKISLGQYLDYMEQCKTLHIKLDKPRSFNTAHANLTNRIQARKDRYYSDRIKNRYGELKSFEYKKGNLAVMVFRNSDEIIACAADLHNCMATNYMRPYADELRTIFRMTEDGKNVAGIETYKDEIVQFRAKFNLDPKKEYIDFIKGWAKKMNLTYAC